MICVYGVSSRGAASAALTYTAHDPQTSKEEVCDDETHQAAALSPSCRYGYRLRSGRQCDASQLRMAARPLTSHAMPLRSTWLTGSRSWRPHDDLIQKRRSGPGATPGPLKIVVLNDCAPHTAPTV
jgi:hypothetical protein